MEIVRTSSDSGDFKELVRKLDVDLAGRDGKDHSFYAQFNTIENIKYAIVAYEDGEPVGCGAMKRYDASTMEVKRMYTVPAMRGMGIAGKILSELEKWAAELSFERCVLETGKRQPEAIALYRKNGYRMVPNYGQYAGVENSVCFAKELGK
jgi:putative acetyltransferase